MPNRVLVGHLEGAAEEIEKRLSALDAALARSIADADAGRVHDADEVFDELRRRYHSMCEHSAK
jgi:antitoxin ParD1/3/4